MPYTTIQPTSRIFSDLDLNFLPNPITGDIQKIYDVADINRSVTSLVLTANYERLFHSEIGTQIPNMLFEPFGPMTNTMINKTITNVITQYEPRVNLITVNVGSDINNQNINVSIQYTIVNTVNPIQLNLVLARSH